MAGVIFTLVAFDDVIVATVRYQLRTGLYDLQIASQLLFQIRRDLALLYPLVELSMEFGCIVWVGLDKGIVDLFEVDKIELELVQGVFQKLEKMKTIIISHVVIRH